MALGGFPQGCWGAGEKPIKTAVERSWKFRPGAIAASTEPLEEMAMLKNRVWAAVLALGWFGIRAVLAGSEGVEDRMEAWVREVLAESVPAIGVSAGWRYPAMDVGTGWSFVEAGDPWARWFSPLLWEAYFLSGEVDLLEAGKAVAQEVVAVGDGVEDGLGELLLRWGQADWEALPRDRIEAYLGGMEARWMPAVGAFWGYTEGRPLTATGLAGGWVGKDNTALVSLVEMAALWQVAGGADSVWEERVRSHVAVVLEHHLREDGGSAEVVVFGPDGPRASADAAYSGETTLARSHAMGMLGLARLARLTGEAAYQEAFQRMAAYVEKRSRMEIPRWDLGDAPVDPTLLSERFAVEPWRFNAAADDPGAAAILAVAFAEALPLVSAERAWRYYHFSRQLTDRLVSRSAVDPGANGGAFLRDTHAEWPGARRGSIQTDYFLFRAWRLLAEMAGADDRLAMVVPGAVERSLMVTHENQWQVRTEGGDPALLYVGADTRDSGNPAFCLFEGRVWTRFELSLLLWPDRSAGADLVEPVVVFGYTSPENYLVLTLGGRSGVTRLERMVGGRREGLGTVNRVLPVEPSYNELRVEGTGDQLIVEVGGDEWLRLDVDPDWMTGMAGFGADGPFWFDDVVMDGTYTMRETPMTAWRKAVFGGVFLAEAWDGSDPDGDGRENILEYAFGTDPLGGDRGESLRLSPDSGVLRLEYPLHGARNEAMVLLQRSTDGGSSWVTLPDERDPLASGWQTVTAAVSPPTAAAQLFRLLVERRALER
jgi:hypothetical protein